MALLVQRHVEGNRGKEGANRGEGRQPPRYRRRHLLIRVASYGETSCQMPGGRLGRRPTILDILIPRHDAARHFGRCSENERFSGTVGE